MLEPDIEQQNWFKLGKESMKAVYCHPAYGTYMQSIKVPCNLVSGEHEKDRQGGREEGVSTLTFVLDEALHLLLDAVVPVGDVHV